MSVPTPITWRSLPIESYNQFTANFNNPLGQYGFTQVAANANQLVINTNPNFIYLIDRVSFSASIDEGVYLQALGAGSIQPTLRFRFLKASQTSLYPYALPAINYKDGLEFAFFFYSPKRGDQLLISMAGVLNQVAAMVGVGEIIAQASFVIYQENNAEKINKMKNSTGPLIGRYYREGEA